MSGKSLVLCVDDEPINITIIEELLQDEYEVISANSGHGCLESVSRRNPDLILLDVIMPEMDGLETCRRLKQDPVSADVPVIFISALASDPELMAGYESGGDDYIGKPFSGEILQKKIEIVLSSQRRKQELKKISDNAVEALMGNLSNTGELGLVVKFLRESLSVSNLQDLATNVFDCLRRFELDCSLLILSEPENLFWFSDDIDRPMEKQILESLHRQDRQVNFGNRLAINSDKATILIRNMPTDEERVQQLRDHFTILVEGLDARISGMQSEILLTEREDKLVLGFNETKAKLQAINKLHKNQTSRSSELLSVTTTEIDKLFRQLDLTASQEGELRQLLQANHKKIEAIQDDGHKIDDQLDSIIDELSDELHS